jgi:uncharacterized membrane protein YphA (DoxX/SURF4 family)
MQRAFTSFPSGWAGAALLVLRVVVGTAAIVEAALSGSGSHSLPIWVAAASAVLAGLALVVGFLTPIASALLAAEGALILLYAHAAGLQLLGSRMALFELVVMAAALAILGPGAASIDARLFGRREVAIRSERRPNDL